MNGHVNGTNGLSHSKSSRLIVDSPYVKCDGTIIESKFSYRKNQFEKTAEGLKVIPKEYEYTFRTQLRTKRTGLLLVGLGGNNGSTAVGSIFANKKNMSWRTKDGVQSANYFGSVTQASTIHLGWDGRQQIHVPFNEIIPILSPNDLIIDGWDINNQNLYEAMIRAKVFEPELQEKLRPYMEPIVPMPSIYYPDFIASNQGDRANNVISGNKKEEHLEHIRRDIRQFKMKHDLGEFLHNYISVTPLILLVQHNVFVGGDDFKSGQTKIKSALVDFLVSSGLKPESIVSYNHLGNNDGKNLSEAKQFRSKEISKSSVVDDMVQANKILYPTGRNPDHCIVIKYVPFVGDSKRAMDEYICRLVLSMVSLLLKAPVVPAGTPVSNAFMRQFASLAKLISTLAGVVSDADMQIEFFTNLATPL
uniref:inositol-3-phosphate synthase n=1 Tax=Heterorhabditis bacteriophora TaxID=37862 RepID=A0A1I7XPV2_HETBA